MRLVGTATDADIAIGDLIDGFDEIATLAIPYARLPRRATTAFASSFTRWQDLAAETAMSLSRYPQAGQATIQALVEAAREAVTMTRSSAGGQDLATAVEAMLDRLSERDLILLTTRIWALQPRTQTEVARQLQVNPMTVRRNERRTEDRFRELLADPLHAPVAAAADELARRLGVLTSESIAAAELHQLGLELHDHKGLALLAAAGPYRPHQHHGWLENSAECGARRVATTIEAVLGRRRAPTTAELVGPLKRIGVVPDTARAYLNAQPALRRVGAQWVRSGDSMGDRIEALLHLAGDPVPVHDIIRAVRGTSSPRTVRETLSSDDRFVRVSLRNWALSRWGLPAYTGIFDAVCECIDAANANGVTVDTVVAEVQAMVPDVAEDSIRAYVNRAPAFVVKNGIVRRRTKSDKAPKLPPLRTAPGAFRTGADEIRLALTVDQELLRGSGRTLPRAVAAALGVTPGKRKTFRSDHGPVTVIWRISSTNGATFSSLRAPAMALGAQHGDTLVLAFGVKRRTLTAARISADTPSRDRLCILLGRDADDPLSALADALDCPPEDVEPLLRKRNELYLLNPAPARQ